MGFNLNKYLRSFIHSDLTQEYEMKCLEIVSKYKDSKSTEVLLDMFDDFNRVLIELGEVVLQEQKKFEEKR